MKNGAVSSSASRLNGREKKREEERRREKRGVLEDKKDASESPSAKWDAEGCGVQHKAHDPPPPTSSPPPTTTSLPWW